MQYLNEMIARLINSVVVKDEEGQTLVEYALIIALVSIVAVGALTILGSTVTGVFNSIIASF